MIELMPWLERRPEIEPLKVPDDPDPLTVLYVSAHNQAARRWNKKIRRDNRVLDAFDQIRHGSRMLNRAKGAGIIFLEVVRTVTSDPAVEIAERIGIVRS